MLPDNESERLLALLNTQLLDSAPEERFDRITRLAAQFFGVQTCVITLVDEKRQWFKSKVGLNVTETDRDISFCSHAILSRNTLIIEDASKDARFSENPLVTGSPNVRFYAGAPVCEPGGFAVGTLCLIDEVPRALSGAEIKVLRDFADLVEQEIANISYVDLQKKLADSVAKTSSILRTLPDMVFVIDSASRFLLCNDHPDLLRTPDQVLGKTVVEVLPNELGRQIAMNVENALASGEILHHNYSLDEVNKSFEARYRKINQEEVLVVIRNITREISDAKRIQNSESKLRAVIDANNIGTWRLNMLTDSLEINDKWASLLGYTLGELKPINRATWERLTHPEDLAYCAAELEKHASGTVDFYEANIRMLHKNGNWVWITTRGRVSSYADDGRAEWMLGTHINISAQIIAESSLHEQSQQMEAIVENMLDGVITIDKHGAIQTFNQAAEQIFGYPATEIVGENVSVLMNSPHREHHDYYLENYFNLGIDNVTGRNRELEARHKDGSTFPIELSIVEVEKVGEINFIGIVKDITERKKKDEEIRRLAFYDALTELPNRRLLLDRLERAIANCSRLNRYAALLFLDLDNFKDLNDSAGHSIGDLLLCRVAQRISESVRETDTVSRIGGDEFVVLVENLNEHVTDAIAEVEIIAEKIRAKLAIEFDLNGLTYYCSVSVGVTMLKCGDTSIEDLLKQADLAMYKAKAAGRNGVQFFDPDMQKAVSARVDMERELYLATERGQFVLHYQKQVNAKGRVIGAEALLRWLHPTQGMVSPAQFIPIAERTGLIVPVGDWVIQQACETLASWSADPLEAELTMAVNISVVQFSKEDIVDKILNALQSTGANPARLKLEITETLLASDVPDIQNKMEQLQQHGISFSIDDFGTGYSSLTYLKQLPIRELKIDQSFVRDINYSTNDQAIAKAIITMAESLNLNVIAEGVETEEQRALLESIGCLSYQGYLFARPCSLEDFTI